MPALAYQPIHFGPADRVRFGWYHPAGTAGTRGVGVVLCNPIGDDYVRAHRSLRHLADQLSAAGFAVLRFDFSGTGDSSGDERPDGMVRTWREDIRLAVDELRQISGATKISVVGLRLGATLAMVTAAETADLVDSVVLWNPYVTGTAYVGDLTRAHQMHKMLEPRSFAGEPKGWSSGGEEALGFLMTPATMADLGQIDLLKLRGPIAYDTLLIGTGNVPGGDKSLQNHLRSIGREPASRYMPGHKFLIAPPQKAEVPQPILEAIVEWLSARHPVTDAAVAARPPRTGPIEVGQGVREQAIVFGTNHPLFGIVASPVLSNEPRASRLRPAIIVTNAGCVHRIGPHRIYVPMVRRWAALGFHVLRLDLSGIGDSPAAPGARENQMYPDSGADDLLEAMRMLEQRFGVHNFVLVGLGSGADLAFQTGLRDDRVAGTVMMNPSTFGVHDPETVRAYSRAKYTQDSLLRASSWKKALRGQVDFRRALGQLAPRVKEVVKRRVEGLIRPLAGARATTTIEDVPSGLRMMASRGVDTFLLATEGDPGIDFVDFNFKKAMTALGDVPHFRRHVVHGTDHTFTSIFSQQLVSQVVTDHLTMQYLG